MAHLTCELHKRRALVIADPLRPPWAAHILHRNDGTRCGDMLNDFTKYRGHTLTSFTILGGRIPKTQALTRKELRARMLADVAAGRVSVIQQVLPAPRN